MKRSVTKQALTVLLAFMMLFAMAPILSGDAVYADRVWGNTSPEEYGITVSTDKATYDANEDVRYNITGFANTGKGEDTLWLGLYEYGVDYTSSIKWEYINADISDNSLKSDLNYNFPAGHYFLILTTGGTGNDLGSRWATLEFYVGNTCSVSVDKTQYLVGDPIKVTAISDHSNGWVGLYPYNGDLEKDLLSYYYVSDAGGQEVDILSDDIVHDRNKATNLVGKYKCILFTSGYSIDKGADGNLIIKTFDINDVYDGPDWSWNDERTEATATFTAQHDATVPKTKTVNATIGDPPEETKKATEEEDGLLTYTATITSDMIDFATTDEAPFTNTATKVIPKLTHVHTFEAVAAKDPTCTETGNIAYYKCTGCPRYFEDADEATEIEDRTTVVRNALGHDWGSWTYDKDTKMHSRECQRDGCNWNESVACTFVDGDVVDGKRIHTCSVCNGTYTTDVYPVITTDKAKYLYGSDILVTSKLNETTNNGWMAIYKKDQYKDADKYGQSLIWWYVGADETTKNIKEITKSIDNQGIGQDYDGKGLPAGEYEAVYLDENYVRQGDPTYFSVYYKYNDPSWTWADDGSSATATFAPDGNEDDTTAVKDTAPVKGETKDATCTEDGFTTYTATVTVNFATVSGKTSFTDSKKITEKALGHSWGEWTEVTPATETAKGQEKRECTRSGCNEKETRDIPALSHTHKLTAHPAAEATCTKAGNSAYWVCDQGDNPCGKFFSDAEGTKEIEENSWVIAKTDEHDYGDWVFDEKTKTHTKTCSRDATHKVTEKCNFKETVDGDKIKHTCSVCGGSYTTANVLSTDKDTYKLTDPIKVTVNYEGDDNAWVGLYGKDETPNASQNPASIYWYYIKGKSTYDLTKGTKNRDYGAGEYKVILFGDDGFTNIIATKNITLTDAGPSDISIDATSYTMGDPIMVTATSDHPGAWVGLYDYENSDPLDSTLLSYYMLSDSNGKPVDIWNGDIVKDKDKLKNLPAGTYKVILFTSGYDIDKDSKGKLAVRSFELNKKDDSGCDHKWGDWTPDEDAMTHTRVCAKDKSHKETRACSFKHEPSSDPGIEIYTCTVCGRSYEKANVPVIKTDKKEYEVGEDIKVTTELNGHDGTTSGGWVALYEKDPSVYGTSLLWYYPAEFGNPKVLQSVFTPSDTGKENMGEWPESWGDELPAGEYELVFLKGKSPYTRVGEPTYFSIVRNVESETVIEEATCEKAGSKHVKYEDGFEEDVEIPALGHDPKKEWTYDAKNKKHYHECSRCKAHVDEAACTFDEGKVTKEPTATEEGEKTFTCTKCKGTYTEAIPTLANQGVKRVYGSTRYQTSMLLADELKAQLKVDKFDAVIVATGENYADALSGSYLGYVKKAPILLVKKGTAAEVNAYIKKNLKEGGTVYLLGGEAVVPGSVAAGLDSKRLFGATRYETNIEILKEAGVRGEDIMICDGNNFADSLSASAAKKPILLVNKKLNAAQRSYLETLRTRDYYLIGGTGAIPAALEDEVSREYGSVTRLGGKDRFETSAIVAKTLFSNPSKAVLAYGMNYPDGLCGGTLATCIDEGVPLLLVRNDRKSVTAAYTNSKGVTSGYVLGGPTLIADSSARTIFGMSKTDEIYVVNK